MAEKSSFDTEHFGFGIGKVKHVVVSDVSLSEEALYVQDVLIKECLSWMKQNDIKCVIARVNLDDALTIAAHERNGFQLADVLVTFHLNNSSMNPNQGSQVDSLSIHPSYAEDEEKLMEIARNAFTGDHFHKDFHFPKDKSDELFAKWVCNCCHGLADTVLVASEVDEEPRGFITCKIEQVSQSRYGIIDLVAVSPSYQGQGIGASLVMAAVKWFGKNGVQSIFVGTQVNNLAAIRTYEKIGFRPASTELTFHKWFEA